MSKTAPPRISKASTTVPMQGPRSTASSLAPGRAAKASERRRTQEKPQEKGRGIEVEPPPTLSSLTPL